MIKIANYVHLSYRHDADLYGRYIIGCGAQSKEYCVAPVNDPCAENMTITAYYEETLFAGRGPITKLTLPFRDGAGQLVLGLRDAFRTLAFLFDNRDYITALQMLTADTGEQSIPAHLDIPHDALREHVAAWAEGNFIAPDNDGYLYFQVDTFGDVQPLARSKSLAVIAWKYWMDEESWRNGLSSRIAAQGHR